jgi:hypothetical protein
MGYALTVVPVGSAPPGTVIELLVLDVESVMVVGVVAETVPETGVPKDDAVTSLGGAAFAGPIDVVSNDAAALGGELLYVT